MAERGKATEIYEFFYHAVNSSVHASLHHLLRVVWYNRESHVATITNKTFEQYYSNFALIYGSWMASALAVELLEEFGLTLSTGEDTELSVWMVVIVKPAVIHRQPPIVTLEELARPKPS
ncbi:hypothetical protein Sinac_2060 [Singulisphaera acidiphila DSM 18658]|uniref:Uncharacterized protein n=1 Tax=Singulisphaera acidiphila (strain ATCC BAA-1392 / DSM 18658 / VKM B-2454 / MOB10) TaxID=886293 RepID=L0DAZ6_SINAD|nr:hypothetical protein Sinac_2060 [Singulisphaera acidiphila DSM 18658]